MLDDASARAAVVAAADRLFYAQGVQSVGMDAVRAEAGVSLKRIYSLFPSKDDLVVAVLRQRTRRWDEGIAQAAAGAATPRDRLLAVFDFLDTWFREDGFRGCAVRPPVRERCSSGPGGAASGREHTAEIQRYARSVVREAGLPDDVALQVVLLAEGAQTTAAITQDLDVARQARRAAEAILDAAVPATA